MFICLKMSLAILGIVGALHFDNELRVISMDCFERLAIGQRINSNDTYKWFPYKTVTECKKACSQEKFNCKAFAFGISSKGNATCELSQNAIKETVDLKPIGTIIDTDFDLYIKKFGCTLVNEPSHHKHPQQNLHSPTKPTTLGNVADDINTHEAPNGPNSPSSANKNSEEIHNVHTIVSVAAGPQTVLNPTHGILVAGAHQNDYTIGKDPLPYWYNHHEFYNNFRPDSYASNYNGIAEDTRPYGPFEHADVDRYDYLHNDNRVYKDRYRDRWQSSHYFYPLPEKYGSVIPHPDYYYKRPSVGYKQNNPKVPFPQNSVYEYNVPSKPVNENLHFSSHESDKLSQTDRLYEKPPKRVDHGSQNDNKISSKPIIRHSIGSKGVHITSIITEITDKACFRRVLAGKRISRGLVRRALACETVEECQAECAEEKLFICEGFNYRLDPSGRGKGDCELLNVPLSRIDVYRDSYPDPDYDYYERDRNAAALNCKQRPGYNNYDRFNNGYNDYDDYRHGIRGNKPYSIRDPWANRRYDYDGPERPFVPDRYIPSDPWRNDYHRPTRPQANRRYDIHSYDYNNRPPGKRRGDYSYLPQINHFYNERDRFENRRHSADPVPSLLPPYDQNPFDSFPSVSYHRHPKNQYHWGIDNNQRYGENFGLNSNSYLPPRKDAPNDWGLYHKYKNNFSYWGVNSYAAGGYLPPDPALKPPEIGNPLAGPKIFESGVVLAVPDSAALPVEHRRPDYNPIQDECSLRSVAGFKLHKRIVKKYFAVPNIYECEMLCFKEKDFPCASFAFRYTTTIPEPTDNCYLSNVDYKELDHYTDLEPDRDFDVYTMNNRNRCIPSIVENKESSDCFWRVRSGERLHDKIVRDSLQANSIVDCQVECLKSRKFTCRAYSYRYGPHIAGGLIDNCQLTDWPYYELDPTIHFVLEPGFEIYERGSFGHGCESSHFGIRGHHEHKQVLDPDQLCYIGFGSPARLLPQAIKKSVRVASEIHCKEECSKARQETLFQCMSFSFRSRNSGANPNCDLSDIYQRDLLPKLDYVYDPHSLLFAWDNYNPDCVLLGDDPLRTNHITSGLYDRDYLPHGMDTWRVYSVSGWPCKRGARCQENREAGFWFCELEGGIHGSWDYCCRPDHQCGASSGYPYLWCYVGPDRTQWRKCNDRYYPYLTDRNHFEPNSERKKWERPLFRPDRAPGYPPHSVPSPSLDEYEKLFNEQFLQPPAPSSGGVGEPRHWPVSYLHKEMPPNVTTSKSARIENDNTKYRAIQNLIDTIKNNDLKNIQYEITSESDKKDDVLFVKIPLPTNLSRANNTSNSSLSLEPIAIEDDESLEAKRLQKSLPQWYTKEPTTAAPETAPNVTTDRVPVYRRAFITRTNVTTHGRRSR